MKTRILIYDRGLKLFTFVNNVELKNPDVLVFSVYKFPFRMKLISFSASQICDALMFAHKHGKRVMRMEYGNQGHPWSQINASARR